MNGSQQKGKIFIGVIFTNCPKDGENNKQAMEFTLNKVLFIILPHLTCFLKNPHFILVHLVYKRKGHTCFIASYDSCSANVRWCSFSININRYCYSKLIANIHNFDWILLEISLKGINGVLLRKFSRVFV